MGGQTNRVGSETCDDRSGDREVFDLGLLARLGTDNAATIKALETILRSWSNAPETTRRPDLAAARSRIVDALVAGAMAQVR